jgi:hypothetical protein
MNEFIQKVAEMRSAQRNYFRYRGTDFLATAKILEAEVDEQLKILLNQPENTHKKQDLHPKLF